MNNNKGEDKWNARNTLDLLEKVSPPAGKILSIERVESAGLSIISITAFRSTLRP
jgi:hypothetical protein